MYVHHHTPHIKNLPVHKHKSFDFYFYLRKLKVISIYWEIVMIRTGSTPFVAQRSLGSSLRSGSINASFPPAFNFVTDPLLLLGFPNNFMWTEAESCGLESFALISDCLGLILGTELGERTESDEEETAIFLSCFCLGSVFFSL